MAAATAVAMSEVARTGCSDAAMVEVRAVDERFSAGEMTKPATFVHEVAGTYLLTAGDFVCGMQYVTAPAANLRFSSASLARSASELANRAWWVASTGLTYEQRIARAIGVLENTIDEEAALFEGESLSGLRGLKTKLDQWRSDVGLSDVASLPRPTKLFKLVRPVGGADDYKRLCNVTHGSLLTVLECNRLMDGMDYGSANAWWRVLTACGYGLSAAHRLAELRGTTDLESLRNASAVVGYFSMDYEQWADHHSSQQRPVSG